MRKYQKNSSSYLPGFISNKLSFNHKKSKRNTTGFTLIELLVVISVLGVLATGLVTIIDPLGQMEKARDVGRKSALRQIANALEEYYVSNGSYPLNPSYCDGSSSGADASWIPAGLYPDYIKTIPVDPKGNDCYCGDPPVSFCYNYISNDPQSYLILTQLENINDPQINGDKYWGDFFGGAFNVGNLYIVASY